MCTQARKAVKDAQEKLQEEVTAHKHTLDALTNHVNTEAQAKQKILKLGEEAKKQQQWFKDQLTSRADLAKQVEQILKYQINGMKLQSEAQAQGQASKINTLKLSLDETNPQEEPLLATPTPSNGEPALEGTQEPASLPVPETTLPPAPSPTTTVPPQSEPYRQQQLTFRPNRTSRQNQRQYPWRSQHPSRNSHDYLPPNPITRTRLREAWRQSKPRQTYLRSPR